TLTYSPVVKAKKGGVKLRLQAGPDGMKLTPENALDWPVPTDYREDSAGVILSVSDGSGQEVFHNFRLTIVSADKPADAMVPPSPAETNRKTQFVAVPSTGDSPTTSQPMTKQEITERKLPAAADDVAVAGAGRYLLLRIPTEKKVAVFDTHLAEVIRYVP